VCTVATLACPPPPLPPSQIKQLSICARRVGVVSDGDDDDEEGAPRVSDAPAGGGGENWTISGGRPTLTPSRA